MSRFREVLRKASDQLEIAEPAKSRVLLEVAADLEDSYQHYRSQGHDEAQATRLAEESFAVSDQALSHLARIHESGLSGISGRISDQVGSIWQKILLIAILLFEVALTFRILADDAFFLFLSPFVWPLAALALAAFAFSLWKLYQILSDSRAGRRRYRSGLGVLLFLAGVSLAVAGTGFLFHLQRFFRLNYEGAPELLFRNFAGFILGISSMMTVGLLISVFAALLWFVLNSLVSRTEQRELGSMLEGHI